MKVFAIKLDMEVDIDGMLVNENKNHIPFKEILLFNLSVFSSRLFTIYLKPYSQI